jgi:HAD superfamily hydrolase (TIGR01509 family)
MRPTIRAVAFDLDGLMFDTEALFFRVASEMLKSRGKVFTKEIMAAMIGRQAAIAYPAMKEMAGLQESAEELLGEARERFFALIDTAVHPTPGLFSLLSHLETIGMPRAVCTSSRRAYAERLLGNHGLSHHFAFLLCAEDVTLSKPNPEIYLTAASRLGILPTELMVLEDSPAGLTAAKAADVFAVAIPHEHSPAEALSSADLIVTRLDDPAVLALLIRA